jgi:predicted HTH transcriptional regulator
MLKILSPLLGKHIDSAEFRAMLAAHFPDFRKFDKNKEYKDRTSKITLRIDSLSAYDDSATIPADKKEFQYFTAFFFGKDETDIPFGVSAKDDEAAVIKKAGKPTHHNKVTDGGAFMLANDLHYHIQNYKMLISFDSDGKKMQQAIGINLRLKGMRF